MPAAVRNVAREKLEQGQLALGVGSLFEQSLQLVGDSQLHIVIGQLALRGEARVGDIAGVGLRGGDIALDGAAHLSP